MKNKRFRLSEFIKALITGIAIAVPVFLVVYNRGYAVLRAISDACFVPAVFILGAAGIMYARNDGQFDSMGYSIRYVFFNHYPGAGTAEDFAEYRERKMQKRRSPFNILLAGLIFLAVAVLFMILNYV